MHSCPSQAQHFQSKMETNRERGARHLGSPLKVRRWVPVCTQCVTSGKSLIALTLSFPFSLAGTESCGKELRSWGLELEGGLQEQS